MQKSKMMHLLCITVAGVVGGVVLLADMAILTVVFFPRDAASLFSLESWATRIAFTTVLLPAAIALPLFVVIIFWTMHGVLSWRINKEYPIRLDVLSCIASLAIMAFTCAILMHVL